MATLLPWLQFEDALGVPLAGGTVSFYTANTLTLKTIYANEAQGATLTNPLELDSEGRVPEAGVWVIGEYRIRVKDADDVIIYDIDDVSFVNPYDWTGLTATVADINAISGSLATPGTVIAEKAVVVDSSKNIATFGILTAATLRANTAVRTPQINDANNVAAVTIASVASQVNAVTLTPAATGNNVTIAATGGDADIALVLNGKGTKGMISSGLTYPVADGTSGQFIQTNGAGVLSLASIPVASQIVKQVVTNTTTTFTSTSSVIPYDDTIPQIGEGTEILTCTITPTSASSSLMIIYTGNAGSSGTATGVFALFRDATAAAISASATTANTGVQTNVSNFVIVSATAVASTTFSLRFGSAAGTVNVNGTSAARKFGGVQSCGITVIEF